MMKTTVLPTQSVSITSKLPLTLPTALFVFPALLTPCYRKVFLSCLNMACHASAPPCFESSFFPIFEPPEQAALHTQDRTSLVVNMRTLLPTVQMLGDAFN